LSDEQTGQIRGKGIGKETYENGIIHTRLQNQCRYFIRT